MRLATASASAGYADFDAALARTSSVRALASARCAALYVVYLERAVVRSSVSVEYNPASCGGIVGVIAPGAPLAAASVRTALGSFHMDAMALIPNRFAAINASPIPTTISLYMRKLLRKQDSFQSLPSADP